MYFSFFIVTSSHDVITKKLHKLTISACSRAFPDKDELKAMILLRFCSVETFCNNYGCYEGITSP